MNPTTHPSNCSHCQIETLPPPRLSLCHIVTRVGEEWMQPPSWLIIEAPPDWQQMDEGKRMRWLMEKTEKFKLTVDLPA